MNNPETVLQIVFYLNVLSLTLSGVMVIGLFFCLDFFENVQEKIEDFFTDDFPSTAFFQFLPVLNLFYIFTYIFSTDIILLKVILMFEFLYSIIAVGIGILLALVTVLQKLERVHNNIRYRKGK